MAFYRIIASLLAPLVALALLWRLLRGREGWRDLGQRVGGGSGEYGAIWLHGASNGELTSARALITELARSFPDRPLVITTNTVTGRDMVAAWGIPGLHPRLAPLDYCWALARFRRRWRPAALITLENELWPNRILTAREPVLWVAARISARTARNWQRLGGLMRAILRHVTWLSAQDDGSAARFASLGLPSARLGPVISLKPGVTLPAPPAEEFGSLARIFSRENTLLAASTHEGEDAPLIAGFTAAQAQNPALKLILAPRHPRRAREIAELASKAGLSVAIRSESQPPSAQTDLYLADTLGEMALWYALAGLTFVGGSLVDKGGHTPFEPVQVGSALLHGPYVSNFTKAYQQLDQAGAAISVGNSAEITTALARLNSATAQQALASAARQVFADQNDAAEGPQEIIAALKRAMAK